MKRQKREAKAGSAASSVLDDRVRTRRLQKHLDELEKDNHAPDIQIEVQALPEHPNPYNNTPKRRRQRKELTRPLSRKNLAILLEEAKLNETAKGTPNYFTILTEPSQFPARHFCTVCGFESTYTCIQCGMKYCSIKCRDAHRDTRCQKFVV